MLKNCFKHNFVHRGGRIREGEGAFRASYGGRGLRLRLRDQLRGRLFSPSSPEKAGFASSLWRRCRGERDLDCREDGAFKASEASCEDIFRGTLMNCRNTNNSNTSGLDGLMQSCRAKPEPSIDHSCFAAI